MNNCTGEDGSWHVKMNIKLGKIKLGINYLILLSRAAKCNCNLRQKFGLN